MNAILYITVAACTLVACGFGDGGEMQLAEKDLGYTAVCSDEIMQQFATLSDEEKSRELQKLQAQNTSALLMMNFMSEYVNWDEFLYDLPIVVTELGELMLFSNKRDFTLYRDNFTYKYIQRPESFRASLVQLAHTEWTALNAAHHNMDKIRLNTIPIPGIFRIIFRILKREKNVKNRNLLTSQLNRIKNLAVRNREVCADSITKINNTINLINELQMATLSAQSEEKDRLNVLMKEKAAFDAKLSTSTALLHDVNNDLKRQLDRVKQLERQYEQAQKEATPRVGEIFFSAIVDIVKFAPQLLSNVMAHLPSAPSVVERMPSPKPTAGNKQTNEQVDELNDALGVANQLDEVLERSELDSKSADAIDGLLGKVATFRNDLLKKLISTFLKSVKNAYKAASGVSEEDRNKMKNELDKISSQVRSDVMKALAETTSNGHTVMLNNRLMKMSANSRDTYGQIMGSRLEKLKAATDTLINANKQYESFFNRKLALMDRNSEYIARLAVIDFTKIDFEEILKVMREGVKVLSRQIEQWKRFLEFFKIIENLTQLASEQTGLFINGTLQGVKDGALMNVYGNDDIYMDMLYEHSFVTIDIAKALNEMTTTYVRVSNKHVFPRLNGITKLLALEDPAEINAAFRKLAAEAQLATSEFRNELKDDYLKQQQRIKERVDQISCLMSVLKEDPYIKKAIEQNGYDVDIPGIPDF